MAIKLRIEKPILIDPRDVSENTALGIRFPFNKKRIFDLDFTSKAHAKSKLMNLLMTSPGERLNQPLFGAGLKNRLFEQQTEIASDELREYINPQVATYVPEISITSIDLQKGGVGKLAGHQLSVTINYTVLNNRSSDSLTVNFINNDFNNTQTNY